jgi:hypothetical protein
VEAYAPLACLHKVVAVVDSLLFTVQSHQSTHLLCKATTDMLRLAVTPLAVKVAEVSTACLVAVAVAEVPARPLPTMADTTLAAEP